jgi:hypothetical protein
MRARARTRGGSPRLDERKNAAKREIFTRRSRRIRRPEHEMLASSRAPASFINAAAAAIISRRFTARARGRFVLARAFITYRAPAIAKRRGEERRGRRRRWTERSLRIKRPGSANRYHRCAADPLVAVSRADRRAVSTRAASVNEHALRPSTIASSRDTSRLFNAFAIPFEPRPSSARRCSALKPRD